MVDETPTPYISIVVAVYNGEATLERCLTSVFSQEFPGWELIVIDGGSKDGTVELLKRHSNRIAYWVSEPDRGIYHAWNKALKKVRGEWVVFLGADDFLYDSGVLAAMVGHLQHAAADFRIVYGKVVQVDDSGEPIRSLGEPWEKVRRRFTVLMMIPHPGTFHHQSLFAEHGDFCEQFAIAGDYEFLLRELPERPALFVADLTVTAMQVGGVSASPANNLRLLKESMAARRMRGIGGLPLHYPLAMVKNYLRLAMASVLGDGNVRKLLDLWRRLTGRKPYWTKL